ncbi:hypothetical protein LTR20_007361 [Exophiala xenobiotica]|nr:hypothetical protein LTS06_008045 [Exophiala xenobiotica]KAK5283507.1 hypothetical protein LTR40_001650 [Exophiala xenobiotica]KAK5371031.1 hypothetical protein LTS13_006408 [Exophiala xenobiotica]KAK5401223.1 hypothetical protein LTR79_001742 [Exophiala xenobiotica]KAK5409151.1 hypothetical protein LTR90_009274 [Exophiala xenobiotica]
MTQPQKLNVFIIGNDVASWELYSTFISVEPTRETPWATALRDFQVQKGESNTLTIEVDSIGGLFDCELLAFNRSKVSRAYVITFLFSSRPSFELAGKFSDTIADLGDTKCPIVLMGILEQDATTQVMENEASKLAAALGGQFILVHARPVHAGGIQEVQAMEIFTALAKRHINGRRSRL